MRRPDGAVPRVHKFRHQAASRLRCFSTLGIGRQQPGPLTLPQPDGSESSDRVMRAIDHALFSNTQVKVVVVVVLCQHPDDPAPDGFQGSGVRDGQVMPACLCIARHVRAQTVRTVEPVVLRAARSACALAASFSG